MQRYVEQEPVPRAAEEGGGHLRTEEEVRASATTRTWEDAEACGRVRRGGVARAQAGPWREIFSCTASGAWGGLARKSPECVSRWAYHETEIPKPGEVLGGRLSRHRPRRENAVGNSEARPRTSKETRERTLKG